MKRFVLTILILLVCFYMTIKYLLAVKLFPTFIAGIPEKLLEIWYYYQYSVIGNYSL